MYLLKQYIRNCDYFFCVVCDTTKDANAQNQTSLECIKYQLNIHHTNVIRELIFIGMGKFKTS